MNKARNTIFVILSFFILFAGVMGYRLVWQDLLGGQTSNRSALEARQFDPAPVLSVQNWLTGAFQKSSEKNMADYVIMRDDVLLADAVLQRKAIELSNVFFDYPAYPAFFGSGLVIDKGTGALAQIPNKRTDSYSPETLNDYASRIARLASDHEGINWVYYLPDSHITLEPLPVHSLVSEPADYSYFEREFLQKMSGSIAIVSGKYSDIGEFYSDYYKTDHHWKVQGAAKAYEKIVTHFDREPIAFKSFGVAKPSIFSGSQSRTARMMVPLEDFYDASYDRDRLDVTVNGEAKDEGILDYAYGHDPASFTAPRFFDVHARWFHTDYGLIELFNAKADDGSLLILGDSYTNCMERFFAENYRFVYVLDPRYYKGTVRQFLASHDVDDVLILMRMPSLMPDGVIDVLAS